MLFLERLNRALMLLEFRKALSPKLERAIAADYSRGATVDQLSVKYGLSKYQVSRVLEWNNAKPMRPWSNTSGVRLRYEGKRV